MITTRFPHLARNASWTAQNDAGLRLLALYEAQVPGEQARLLAAAGLPPHAPYKGETSVFMGSRETGYYTAGITFPMAMARMMVVFRSYALARDTDRRHYVQNAWRIRRALCTWGLDIKPRKVEPCPA